MSQAINLSWTPPAAANWNFTPTPEVCTAASRWTGTYVQAIRTLQTEEDHPVPISFSVFYLWEILPSEYRENTTFTELAAWFIEQHLVHTSHPEFTDFWDEFISYPLDHCTNELCPEIGWQEDPDLAGVGMLTSYYIVAGLTTFYYVLLLLPDRFQENKSKEYQKTESFPPASSTYEKDERKPRRRHENFGTRIVKAFRKTLNNFLLADLIFTVGILGAALWRFHSSSDKSYTTFNQLMSFVMSCFSILSCLVLQAVAKAKRIESHDRHIYRWNLALPWMVVVPMTIVLGVMFFRNYSRLLLRSSEVKPSNLLAVEEFETAEWVWLSFCDPQEFRIVVEKVLYVGLALLCVNAIWYSVALMHRVRRLWHREKTKRAGTNIENNRRSWVTTTFRYTRRFDGLGCAVMMWAFLIMFHIYRDDSHNKAQASDGSKEWSFGQILALAAWAPTLVELFNKIFLHPLVDTYHDMLDENDQRGAVYDKSQRPDGHRFESSQTV